MKAEHDLVRPLAIFGDARLTNVSTFLRENGFVLPDDGKQARGWCETRAVRGDVFACYVIAEMFHLGLFGPVDQKKALQFAEVAGDAGLAPALLLLASLTEGQDESKAIDLMQQSAEHGYAPAMYAAALKYMVDGANQSDKELGLKYLIQAARCRYPPAQTTLATHLLESGEDGEIPEGIELMQKAAEHGSSHAHRMLAHYFRAGRYGLEANPTKASKLQAEADRIEAEALEVWGLRA